MAHATRRILADTSVAPAAAATWESGELALIVEGATGTATLGTRLVLFIFHQDEDFGWKVEGTEDGTLFHVLDAAAAVTGHAAGAKGLTVLVDCPFAYAKVSVTNAGAGTSPMFRVVLAVRDA